MAMSHIPKSKDKWVSNPELIRRFLEVRPRYEELCREAEYILRKRVEEAELEVSAVTCRAKTLNSFLEKVERKAYKAPLDDITDLAGARVVCLYRDDIPSVEGIVADEFEIIERVDKLAEKEPDEFGYGALHFVVRLGARSSGARYDALKGLACEIQVRTVLQDAWAIVEHHLVYKSESAVPSAIKRKLNGLAGLFETADDQFQQVRDQRSDYVDKVRESKTDPGRFLATELNFDSFTEYLRWRFPERPAAAIAGQLAANLETLQEMGYSTLADLHNAIDEDLIERASLANEELATQGLVGVVDGVVPSGWLLVLALGLRDPELASMITVPPDVSRIIRKHASWSASKESKRV
jgi:putative GTP pyrophosphokinase